MDKFFPSLPAAKPLISIVILAWNRKDELKATLDEISLTDYGNYETIVVDNASSDGSSEMIMKHFPRVRLIRLPVNRGIFGYNVGFANARGDYIIVLDDDSHPAQDALRSVADAFARDKNESIAAIAFRIVNNINGRDYTRSWPEGDWITFWGCGAALRREALENCGYYDEDFFIYANEYDLSIRMLNAGYRVVYRPDIIGYHRESATHRSWKRTGWIGARNEAWFHIKHFPWWSLGLLASWTCLEYLWKGFRKHSASYAFFCISGYMRGLIKFTLPLSKREPVKFKVVKRFFRHHWLLAPFSRKILAASKRF